MPSQSEKHTLFKSNVNKIYTFARHKQLKNHTLWSRTSDSPIERSNPNPSPSQAQTHKSTVSLSGNFTGQVWILLALK